MDLKIVVGRRIREFRKGAGLTQEDLAAEIDRTVEALGHIERGVSAPRFDTLERLAKTLKQPVAKFFIDASTDRSALTGKLNFQASQLQKQDLEIVIEQIDAVLKRRKNRIKRSRTR